MLFKFPKNDKQYKWTQHIKNKMLFYGISEQKIKTILKSPDRKEEGIAPKTLAVMKRNDKPKRKEEIWVMYSSSKMGSATSRMIKSTRPFNMSHVTLSKIILISAWRYPGVSKPGKKIPIPDDILEEIKKEWFN